MGVIPGATALDAVLQPFIDRPLEQLDPVEPAIL